MTTERIDIQIREDGSRVVSRNLNDMASSADDASSALDGLKGALAAVGAALALDKLMDWADTWNQAAGLIRNSTKSLEEAAAVQDELYRVAQRTRVEFGAVSELYSRAARAGGDLGATQQDLIKFTEGVGKALAVQGTSATQAAGALFQLGQALTGNKIQAQEYNSLIDNAPVILQTVAKHLEGTGGTIGGLTKLVKDGQVTNKEFFDAFLAGSADLDEQFAKSSALFSQGWTVMTNAAIKYLGELDKTLGVSKQFAEFSQWFADNIQTVAALLTGLGVAMGIAFSASLIQKFTVAIRALWALLLANPFVAVAAAIAGVVSYLYIMRDEIKLGIDETTTLGDLMRAVWESIGPMIQTVADAAATFFGWLTDTGAGTFDELLNQTVGYQHEAEATWLKLLRVVVQVFDMIGAVIRGTFMGVNAVIQNFIGAWMNNFRQLGNAIDGIKELDAGKIRDAVAANIDGYKKAATGAGEAFSEAFRAEVLSQSESGLESLLDKTIARAQEIGRERAASTKPSGVDLSQVLGGGGGTGGEGDPEAAKKAARELERLQNQLDRLVGTIDPVKGAMMDLAEAQSTFNAAVAKGLITQAEADRYMKLMKEDYQEALDPLGALNRELDRQTEILKLTNREREVEEQLFRDVEMLRRDGIRLTEEEVAQLRAKLTAMQELNRVMEYQNRLLEQGTGERGRDFDAWLQGIKGAQAQGEGEFSAGDTFNAVNDRMGGLFDGSQQHIQAQLEQQQEYYRQVQELRDNDLINEQTYNQARAQIWANTQSIQLQTASNFFGQLSGLSKSENKKLAAIGKAAAITQAVIKTYESATSAYAAMAGIPYVGPALGAAAAAAAVAAGMANVQAIRSQGTTGFRTGGSLTVGGYGGTDSQLVAFRATPGEKVQVNTPAQARALEEGGGNAPPQVNQKIVNVVDKSLLGDYLATEEGVELVFNIIEANPERIQAVAGAGGSR